MKLEHPEKVSTENTAAALGPKKESGAEDAHCTILGRAGNVESKTVDTFPSELLLEVQLTELAFLPIAKYTVPVDISVKNLFYTPRHA